MKKVMKLDAFSFEHSSYNFNLQRRCSEFQIERRLGEHIYISEPPSSDATRSFFPISLNVR